MEENKDVAAEKGLHATGGLHATEGLDTGGKPGAENGVCATSETAADCRRIVSGRLRAMGRQSTERRLRAPSGLHAQDRLRAVCEPSAERRLHVADRLHMLDGVGVTGAYALRCDQCRKPILRLETYISVGCVTLCDGCYMNMGTGEFLSKIGGELRVME